MTRSVLPFIQKQKPKTRPPQDQKNEQKKSHVGAN